MATSPIRELQRERDPRGRKPTCECGDCDKCQYRTYRREYMRDYNAGIRRAGSHARTWTPEADALLGTKPDLEVADQLGVTLSAVQHRRRKIGVAVFQRRKKGLNKNGYVVVSLPPHDPLLEMTRSQRQVMEHRLVMARHLGRPLTIDEFVHHKNGIRHDNRIENLELWSRSHPDGQRVADKLEWAVDFIERYALESEFLA